MRLYVFPGDLDERIAKIGSEPIPYMRTDEFSRINLESERILLDLIHCPGGKTIIYTGSGTGAMGAVVENYGTTKKKAIVIDGGSFGHRWLDLCNYYNVPAIDYVVPFAKDIDYGDLEKTIAEQHPDLLLCQHHETSSGQLFNPQKISDICRKHNVSMVVDVISSFLAEPLDMSALGIDICVTSSQKGLNLPAGLSILFFSPKLDGYSYNHRGYYWDFDTNFNNLKRGQTPFSPATILYLQLNERLRQLKAEGGEEKNIARVHHRSEYFKTLCKKYGWEISGEVPCCAITGIHVKENEPKKIFRCLIDKYETFIMPGAKPGFYRISHMGEQTEEQLRELAARIHEFEDR